MPLKDLTEYVDKQALLSLGEDMVRDAYMKVLKPAIMAIAKDSDNKFDDMVASFLPQLDAYLLPVIDKIDGEVG